MATLPSLTPEILVPRLGDSLIESGLISAKELNIALATQAKAREKGQSALLGEVLMEMGLISRRQLDQLITEQIVKLRNALQRANEDLELRVQQRTAELEEAYKKLSELSQLKSNFIANISHEFRTPLTHIKGYLELFHLRELGELNDEQSKALEVLINSSNRLEKLIEDLILFTMMERGKVTTELRPINIAYLINIILDRAKEKSNSKKIAMSILIEDESVEVQADEQKIIWVLNELVENAIKFSASQTTIRLTSKVIDDTVKISVIDEGIGIPAEKLEEIFEPFHQLDGSTTRKYSGTGLGLTLSRAIIRAHGSDLMVESKTGSGSRFSFTLKTFKTNNGGGNNS